LVEDLTELSLRDRVLKELLKLGRQLVQVDQRPINLAW